MVRTMPCGLLLPRLAEGPSDVQARQPVPSRLQRGALLPRELCDCAGFDHVCVQQRVLCSAGRVPEMPGRGWRVVPEAGRWCLRSRLRVRRRMASVVAGSSLEAGLAGRGTRGGGGQEDDRLDLVPSFVFAFAFRTFSRAERARASVCGFPHTTPTLAVAGKAWFAWI